MRVLPNGLGTGSVMLSQDTSGVPGATEAGDTFGAFVRFLHNTLTANEALAVGAPGESIGLDTSAGAVYTFPSVSGLPSGTGSAELDQADAGVGGAIASGNAFGWLGDSH